jgi:anaphase-promoting complex subunit 1
VQYRFYFPRHCWARPGQPSGHRILEGVDINVTLTAPAALVALGLTFFATNNQPIADLMATPDTQVSRWNAVGTFVWPDRVNLAGPWPLLQYLLEQCSHDALMMRVIARHLVVWDSIGSSSAWLEQQLPDVLKGYSPAQVIDLWPIGCC